LASPPLAPHPASSDLSCPFSHRQIYIDSCILTVQVRTLQSLNELGLEVFEEMLDYADELH